MHAKINFSELNASKIAKEIYERIKQYELRSFMIGVSFPNYIDKEKRKELRKKFQFEVVKELERISGMKADYKNPDVRIILKIAQDIAEIWIKPIYICGRYRKLKEMPQTKLYCYYCKGRGCKHCNYKGILSDESVEQILAKYLLKEFGAESEKFHGAGREDIDVLMLGNGRPFVIELINPKKRKANLEAIEKEINKNEKGELEVINLKFCGKEKIREFKSLKAEKIYEAIVSCEKKINHLERLLGHYKITQKTPKRKLSNKKDSEKIKEATILNVEKIDEKSFKVKIKAGSGLYIKEFISGDGNRTKPSISEILENNCRCKKLVCLEILD